VTTATPSDTRTPADQAGQARTPDSQPDRARVDAISERVTTLRAQTEQLVQRASEVSTHIQQLRSSPRHGCSHAEQVATMRSALDALEHELEGLRTAMLTRGVIEQAKGMLMLERHVDADQAFAMLVQLSQTSHRKLIDVASALVASWSAGDRAHA
jgi:outer membrane murein-binding lipoprotein Lpp